VNGTPAANHEGEFQLNKNAKTHVDALLLPFHAPGNGAEA